VVGRGSYALVGSTDVTLDLRWTKRRRGDLEDPDRGPPLKAAAQADQAMLQRQPL
jgi:hypothetical protein